MGGRVPTRPQKRGGCKKVVTLSRFSDKKTTKFSNIFVVRIVYQGWLPEVVVPQNLAKQGGIVNRK